MKKKYVFSIILVLGAVIVGSLVLKSMKPSDPVEKNKISVDNDKTNLIDESKEEKKDNNIEKESEENIENEKEENIEKKSEENVEDKSEKILLNSNEDIVNYLVENVEEVKTLKESYNSNENFNFVIYIEREPDKNSSDIYQKDYYLIYVGESSSDHSNNIYRFAVNKDDMDIVYYDVITDGYLSLEDWRKSSFYN
ncbi:MAG: hypothetical protein ACERKV_12290 [Clostridiaceae bacterium]